jgi:hypothetical protein
MTRGDEAFDKLRLTITSRHQLPRVFNPWLALQKPSASVSWKLTLCFTTRYAIANLAAANFKTANCPLQTAYFTCSTTILSKLCKYRRPVFISAAEVICILSGILSAARPFFSIMMYTWSPTMVLYSSFQEYTTL